VGLRAGLDTQRPEDKSASSAGDRSPIARSCSLQSDTMLAELPPLTKYLLYLDINMQDLALHTQCVYDENQNSGMNFAEPGYITVNGQCCSNLAWFNPLKHSGNYMSQIS
jgi:hypothetical protein